jgi:hypothetical protein
VRNLLSKLCLGAALVVLLALGSMPAVAAGDAPQVAMNVDKAGPRQVETTTGNAVVRDYAAAWQDLARALDQNNPELLGNVWVGFARDQFARAIAEQKKAGLRTRYIDHGHQLEAIFYSAEGGALQLRDTAQLEVQLLDGDTVVHSEQVTAHYLALMTPTTDHWQVRLLQSLP